MLYEIKNLIKRYEGRMILDIDRLNIKKGSVYGLQGPNGAGKTTLLEILAFILRPDEGEFFFNGNRVHYRNSGLLKNRRSVVLVQQHPVLFTTTVYKNVEFPLKVRKIEKTERRRSVDELLSLVGMTSFREAPGHTLSGGETQRVAIAQALACSPDVILLDEPTSSVDIENLTGIENIIRRINKEKGISILFTSHDMLQVSRIADEVVYINSGRLSDTIRENIYGGVVEQTENGKHIMVRDGFSIPVETSRRGSVRFFIDPMNIKIKKAADSDWPDNSLKKGRIMQLTSEGKRVRILVDINIPLIILMDKEKYTLSGFSLGDTVFVECIGNSIEFI